MSFKDENNELIYILLDFNWDIMKVDIRNPTEEELLALRVNWLIPPMEPLPP